MPMIPAGADDHGDPGHEMPQIPMITNPAEGTGRGTGSRGRFAGICAHPCWLAAVPGEFWDGLDRGEGGPQGSGAGRIDGVNRCL